MHPRAAFREIHFGGQVKSKNKLEKAAVEMRYTLTDPFRLYCHTWPFVVKRNILRTQYVVHIYIIYLCNVLYSI